MIDETKAKELLALAKEASDNAYAPYSKFKVGACALFENGMLYKGCNVENASYGLCLCAERNALSSAITSGQKEKLAAIAIFSPNTKFCYPCGACRQWIWEFSSNTLIIVEDNEQKPEITVISALLPKAFEL